MNVSTCQGVENENFDFTEDLISEAGSM